MSLKEKYKGIIDNAIKAIHERTFYAQYPEHPKAYGEDAPQKGMDAFKNMLNQKFEELQQGDSDNWIGEEASPYTNEDLNIKYPAYSVDTLIGNAQQVKKAWKKVSPADRAAILVDSLEKIKERFFDIAYATMHTSGQSFIMSFQASGPHSNDRALEAIALGYQELTRFPEKQTWVKPMGKFEIKMDKQYRAVPKGIGLVVGCSTFPVWNSVPGIYASLVTGNPVIVKPHPKAVLPIAIVVAEIQKSLKKEGFDPKIVQLAVDESKNLITKKLAEHEAVKLIDYTGSSSFGDYLEGIPGKHVFTEKAGVNSVILDSVEKLDDVLSNLAFSVSLYSGQMCTAPQNFFIPSTGVKEGDSTVSYEEVVEKLKGHISGLSTNPKMGPGTLGAIQNENTAERVRNAKSIGGKTILESQQVKNEEFDNARVYSPTIIEVDASQNDIFEHELFGPIVLVIKTESTDQSIELAKQMAIKKGAITCAAYTTDADTEEKIYEEMEEAATPVSMNLTGFIWVNQHAAFSDFHVTGGNPAGNASFTNPEYVTRRFTWVGHRKVVK